MVGVDDRPIRRRERIAEFGDEGEPLVDELGAERDEPLVPDVECREFVGREPARAGTLQKGVALFQHPLVVGHDARETRGSLDEQLVEQAPAHGRLAAHDREVFWSEQHAVRVARQLARLHG